MKYGRTIGWFIGGVVIGAAFGAVPAMAGEGGGDDPFAAVQVMGEGDLDTSRGGDTTINSFNTTVTATATNDVTASIGTLEIEIGGTYYGGDVVISDNALGNFSGHCR